MRTVRAFPRERTSEDDDPIAVVGLACRFPGAPDPYAYWTLLRDGVTAVSNTPPGSRPLAGAGGFLDRVDGFDADFFGVSPREAATMDPQQRLALELGWEAFEDAGIVAGDGTARDIGVFVGAMWDDYATLPRRQDAAARHSMTGLHRGVIANRLSYALDLRGPSMVVDTGQSSSLVAVHTAVESLRRGETALALAGGVNLNLAPESALRSEGFGGLSPDGRCFTFDARANGYVRGEGGGLVVLKPLSRALADGDRVHCVIEGTAVNNDGAGEGLTVPSSRAQEAVLRAAYARAGVDPADVGYLELHGTGTRRGDPVESAALGAVFGPARPASRPLPVGSVKTNIGHLEAAAGVAGLIKTALAIRHRELPPSLNFATPNPLIDFDGWRLRVQTSLTGWPGREGSLLAGVSSFGMGGTNCHVVLSDSHRAPAAGTRRAPGSPGPGESRRPGPGVLPWVVSGRSREAVGAQAARLRAHVAARPGLSPSGVGLTLRAHRTAFEERAVVLGGDRVGHLAGLDALAAHAPAPNLVRGRVDGQGRTAFLFTGQGSQRPGMGRRLHETVPAFADALDEVCERLDPGLPQGIRETMFARPGTPQAAALDGTRFAQAALFALEVALFRLVWRCGVRPDFLVGHSIGELAAAHAAGVLDLPDACALVTARGRLMQEAPRGGVMIAVEAGEEEVREEIGDLEGQVTIGAVNGPRATVVSGDAEAAARVAARFGERGRRTKRLRVGHAFHSPHMDGVLEEFLATARSLTYSTARIPVVSNVTGRIATSRELGSPEYWTRHIRSAVRFFDGVRLLESEGVTTYLELGPGGLTAMTRESLTPRPGAPAAVVPVLRDGRPEDHTLAAALAEAFVRGADVDWTPFTGRGDARVDLPTYAFQRRTHWLEAPEAGHEAAPATDLTDPTDRQDPAAAPEVTAAPPAGADARLDIAEAVRVSVARVLGHLSADTVDTGRTFKELGFDSLSAVEFRDRLAEETGLTDLAPTLIYNHPTPDGLTDFLCSRLSGDEPAAGRTGGADPAGHDEPIAIVGMGCRFPGGVRSPEELWDLVAAGRDAIAGFPADRGWGEEELRDPENPEVAYARKGGFLYDAAAFDAGFFGISPREAQAMDPQQRLVLETSWEALERAGIDPATLRRAPVGVFVGATAQDYGPRLGDPAAGTPGYLLTGGTASVISGRVAYTLGFEGPAVTVDTACSSSLAALHLASRSLRQGECSMAMAGGVTVMATPGMFVEFAQQRGLAPDGRCKPFAGSADGTGWSEGVGMVVLERLSDARRHGHRVLALVRGTAINQDGASNGLTAPNGPSQERVIRQALADARLSPGDVDAVEAHGTGTRLGDPIEAQAVIATYGRDRPAERPLWIGSVKSNIGHTQAAAGIAGVIKMVMAMRHGTLPASLHIDEPTPHVDWSSGSVAPLAEAVRWPRVERARRAGVSSFGISGTNAHAVLEQAPVEPDDEGAAPRVRTGKPVTVPWPLSAKSAAALRGQAAALRAHLDTDEGFDTVDTGFSLGTTRSAFEHRAVLVGADRQDLTAGLDALARGTRSEAVVRGVAAPGTRNVFVFPGQGAQWAGMAVELLAASPVFRERMRECDEALGQVVDWSLLDVLRGAPGAPDPERVDVVQPALFAMMVSLARLWESHGVRPDAVVGHSQGEIAAACVAGGLTLPDAARIVALRSRALTAISGLGGMVSVSLPAEQVRLLPCWDERLDVAVLNGPSAAVVSGRQDALEELLAVCAARDVRAKQIPVSYAAHSAQVEAIRERLLEELRDVEPLAGAVPFYSTVTGELLDTRELDAGYWYRNLREPVLFERVMGTVAGRGNPLLLEVSPHPVLGASALEALESLGGSGAVVGTLRRGDGGPRRFLTSLAEAYAHGAAVDWSAAFAGLGAARTPLPTYAFQRQRYWLAAPGPGPAEARPAATEAERRFWDVVERGDAEGAAAEVGLKDPDAAGALRALLPALSAWRRRLDDRAAPETWRYRVVWRPLPAEPAGTPAGRWLVALGEEAEHRPGTGALLEALARAGAEVVRVAVAPGTGRGELADTLRAACSGGPDPAGVLSLLAADPPGELGVPSAMGPVERTLTLLQAIGDAAVPARVWCVTRGAVAVGAGDAVTAPGQAQVWGLGRVAAVEFPERWGGLVDLPADTGDPAAGRLATVLAGLSGEEGENQVALRGSGVFVRRLVRAPREEPRARSPWAPRGTVLVTGGTGALGAHTARWLAAAGAEHIVLASRGGRGAPGAGALEARLVELGARVSVVACDVADREALAELLGALDADRTPVRSVFHAAGTIENTPLDALTPARFAEVLRSKADGARHLHELTRDRQLDAFVLFSSVSGMWGSAGNGGYAAANAYLDALARHRGSLGLTATSLVWGPWEGEGMMSRDGMDEAVVRHGIRLLPPDRAVEALRHCLGHDEPAPVVVDVDWEVFFPAFTAKSPCRLFDEVPEVRRTPDATRTPAGSAVAEADGTLARRLAPLGPADRREAAARLVRAQVASVLGYRDPEAIGGRTPFKELGVDSVIAVELRNRLQTDTGLGLPVTVVFDHPTVDKSVDFLLASAFPEDAGGEAAGPAPAEAGRQERERELRDAQERIDAMGTDDLVRLMLGERQ